MRPIDSCITQPKAQGPSRTCNESKEEEEEEEEEGFYQARESNASHINNVLINGSLLTKIITQMVYYS